MVVAAGEIVDGSWARRAGRHETRTARTPRASRRGTRPAPGSEVFPIPDGPVKMTAPVEHVLGEDGEIAVAAVELPAVALGERRQVMEGRIRRCRWQLRRRAGGERGREVTGGLVAIGRIEGTAPARGPFRRLALSIPSSGGTSSRPFFLRQPVRSVTSTSAAEKTSERASTRPFSSCSGAMYAGVPPAESA